MKNTISKIVIAIAMTAGLTLTASAANATDQQAGTSTNQASTKCDKASGSFVAPNGITVLNLRTCFDVKILKKMGCDTEAGKIEQPAPPRDPKSKCKGKASVKFKIDYETPPCPTGYIGGKLTLSLKIKQMTRALGLSKSIASGRVDTWAKTRIKMSDTFKGEVTNDCVLIPVTPTPTPVPTPTPTPTPPPTTPPTTPPTYSSPEAVVDEINDVVEYNSRLATFRVTGRAGETLQIVADAKHGGTIGNGKTQSITLDANGNGTGSVTYTAGEVPKTSLDYYINGVKHTIAAGQDVVWIQVRDAHGNTVWAKSNDFDNTPRPVTP